MKKATRVSTRLITAKRPQRNTNILLVVCRNPFSVATDFRCRKTQVFKLHATERANTVLGFMFGIPRKEVCLNIASRPPVVGVSVVARRRRIICRGT